MRNVDCTFQLESERSSCDRSSATDSVLLHVRALSIDCVDCAERNEVGFGLPAAAAVVFLAENST